MVGSTLMQIYPTLYNKDEKGKIREWRMERDGNRIRTVSGVQDGKQVVSAWKEIPAKRKNTPEEQADFVIQSSYTGKLQSSYHENIEDVDKAVKFDAMCAATYKSFPGPGFVQPKLDGYRCMWFKDRNLSRGGHPFNAVPHIWEELEKFFLEYPNVMLDGELYNHELKDDFEKLGVVQAGKKGSPISDEQYALSKQFVQYHVYDCYFIDQPDAPYSKRLNFLKNAFLFEGEYVKYVPTPMIHTEEELEEWNGTWLEDGYEGLMWRNPNAPYQNRRTKDLLKYKEFEDAEFPIVSVNEGTGNWKGFAKSLTLQLPNGDTGNCGIRGTQEEMRALLERSRAGNPPKEATVRLQNITKAGTGKPRIGVAIKLWQDGRNE